MISKYPVKAMLISRRGFIVEQLDGVIEKKVGVVLPLELKIIVSGLVSNTNLSAVSDSLKTVLIMPSFSRSMPICHP